MEQKIKIAFYHQNSAFPNVDCRNLDMGNPGMGGSEYALLTIAQSLIEYSKDLDITVFAEVVNDLLPPIPYIQINNLMEAISISEEKGILFFVFRYGIDFNFNNFIDTHTLNLKFVIWCHNFVSYKDLNFYARKKSVIRLICVGKEQLDMYRDHRAFLKSDYIYNALPQRLLNSIRQQSMPSMEIRKNVVTYVGSLVPAKGFHLLAEAWPKILKTVPDAVLNVVGTGKLYDCNTRLGKFGIAEESYENSFINYITVEGKILPSVKFWGILGIEKNNLLKETKVGVPNPSGLTETFGFTAIEMQIMGAVIATHKCPGYLDTAYKNAILYSHSSDLAISIIKQLRRQENNYNKMFSFIESNFSLEIIIKEWNDLFSSNIWSGIPLHKRSSINNYSYNLKWIKEILRRIKIFIPWGYTLFPSVIGLEHKLITFMKLIRRLRKIKIH